VRLPAIFLFLHVSVYLCHAAMHIMAASYAITMPNAAYLGTCRCSSNERRSYWFGPMFAEGDISKRRTASRV
jgi:hypothetical protein